MEDQRSEAVRRRRRSKTGQLAKMACSLASLSSLESADRFDFKVTQGTGKQKKKITLKKTNKKKLIKMIEEGRFGGLKFK